MEMATTLARYDLDGYRIGPPNRAGEGVGIDVDIAERATCRNCGHVGCHYRGFHQTEPRRSYRAFIVCPECGHADEF